MSEEKAEYKAVVKSESAAVQRAEPSVEQLVGRMSLIKSAMNSVMKIGEDYGPIDGCGDKPTLLEPGAEKLMCLFRLAPKFEDEIIELPNGHREYRTRCTLYAADGTFNGEGIGSACTLESKWRYRSENTGKEAPKEYWATRNPELLGGNQYSVRKIKSKENGKEIVKWIIFHKVEHDNPADYYNTCRKMAAKRAKVAAARGATAASFLFSQDLDDEDVQDNVREPDAPPTTPKYQQPQPKQQAAPQEEHRYGEEDQPQDTPSQPEIISEAQYKRLWAIFKNVEKQGTLAKDVFLGGLADKWGFSSTKEITKNLYGEIVTWVESFSKDVK